MSIPACSLLLLLSTLPLMPPYPSAPELSHLNWSLVSLHELDFISLGSLGEAERNQICIGKAHWLGRRGRQGTTLTVLLGRGAGCLGCSDEAVAWEGLRRQDLRSLVVAWHNLGVPAGGGPHMTWKRKARVTHRLCHYGVCSTFRVTHVLIKTIFPKNLLQDTLS